MHLPHAHTNLLQNVHELLHNAHEIATEYSQAICCQFSKTFNFHMFPIYPNYITRCTLTNTHGTLASLLGYSYSTDTERMFYIGRKL